MSQHFKLQHFLYFLSMGVLLFASCSKKGDSDQKPPLKSPVQRKKVTLNFKTLKKLKAGERLLPKLKMKKAESFLASKKFNDALEIYSELSKLNNLTAEGRSQLFAGKAACYLGLERYDESIAEWEKVRAIRKKDPYPVQNIASVYLAKGDLKSAKSNLEKAISMDHDILISRIDLISTMAKLKLPQEDLKKEADALYKTKESILKRLRDKNTKLTPSQTLKLVNYLVDIPGNDQFGQIPVDITGPLLTNKSIFIKMKAGFLAVRTAKGLMKLNRLLKDEKNPQVKKAWKTAIKEFKVSK